MARAGSDTRKVRNDTVSKAPKKLDQADHALTLLRRHWGHDQFRPAQAEAIAAISQGKDVLAVLPTGYGKSAVFQVPALMREGTALVVSPLIALMKDQCDDCASRGIPASYVNSHVNDTEQEDRYYALVEGEYKVFYISPERIRNRRFRQVIAGANISLLVVDEAHCASRWGHDFRPMYMRITDLSKLLQVRPTVIAVTATATFDIEEDIAQSLGMKEDYKRIVGDPIRPNLSYEVQWGNPWRAVEEAAKTWDIQTGRYVVYCGTRKGSAAVAKCIASVFGQSLLSRDERRCDWHERRDLAAAYGKPFVGVYHAGLTKDVRVKVQNAFKDGTVPVIVATNAFGMGIDVPNIREVIHFGIPGSLEDYCQEAGRAGRDGKRSRVLIVVEEGDFSFKLRNIFLNNANPPFELYGLLWDWLHTVLDPGDILEQPAVAIAKILEQKCGCKNGAGAVGAVLNTMESYGLVRRRPAMPGSALLVNVAEMQALYERREGLPNQTLAELLALLWESSVHPVVDGHDLESVQVVIDKETLAEQIGKADSTVGKYLREIEEMGVLQIVPQFRGKTTQIVRYGESLTDFVPEERIIAKRAREQQRLALMMKYLRVENRIGLIRDYFLKGLEA